MRVVLLYILLCCSCVVKGQQGTLIYHTSFEIDSNKNCEHSSITGEFSDNRLENFYNDIFTSLNSVDIYSYCENSNYSNGIPLNNGGFQYPNGDNNYIGLIIGGDTINSSQSKNYREWIGINPHYNFVKDKFYQVSFYISVGDTSGIYSIPPQIYFSTDSIYYNSQSFNTNFDTIINSGIAIADTSNIYSDTANWVQINCTYQSNGEESYIYLGNFFDSQHTKWDFKNGYIPQYSRGYSYFFIDDLSIYELDSTVNINETPISPITIYPNPSNGIFTVENTKPIKHLKIYSSYGQLIFTASPNSDKTTVDLTHLPAGIYLCNIDSYSIKLIKE